MTFTSFSDLNKNDIVVKPGAVDRQAPRSSSPRRSPDEIQNKLKNKLYNRGQAWKPGQTKNEEPPSVF